MIIIPFALLVKITTPRPEAAEPVTNAFTSPLSPGLPMRTLMLLFDGLIWNALPSASAY